MPTASPTDSPTSILAARVVLIAALVVGLALRIAYGWPDPSPGRSWDERFGLPNIESILRTGALRPVNAFHPSLSYLPQTLVLAAVDRCRCLDLGTGTDAVLHWDQPARPRPAGGGPAISSVSALGYRTCRLFQALLGVAAQWLLYRLARSVVSRWSAVGAAATLGFVPWHLWIAGVCNEESGLFVAFEIAALATLSAARRRSLGSAALAGVAFGATLATKLNGGLAALPFAIWSLLEARRDRRALARLAAAALAAVATFCALNPHFLTDFDMVRRDFGYTVGLYGSKATVEQTGRLDALWGGFTASVSPDYLGLALALLAAGGLLATALPASRSAVEPEPRARLRLLALFPLTYACGYALVTPRVDPHNALPLLPFALLFAAAGAEALVEVARRAAGARWAAAMGALAFAAALPVVARGVGFVYRATVETTPELAVRALAGAIPARALVLRPSAPDRDWVGRRRQRNRWLEIEVDPAHAALDQARLDRLDAWVMESRSGGEAAERADVAWVRPGLFRARGPELVVAVHPWHRVEVRRARLEVVRPAPRLEVRIELALPDGSLASHSSLRLGWIGAEPQRGCELRLADGASVPLHFQDRRPRALPGEDTSDQKLLFSERFAARVAWGALTCDAPSGAALAEPSELLDWLPTGAS